MRRRPPSPKIKRAAWALFEFVRRDIKTGMDGDDAYFAERPARLHDELKMFLDVYDSDEKYRSRRG